MAKDVSSEVIKEYNKSQIAGLRTALSVLAVIGVIALFFTGRIPRKQPGSEPTADDEPAPGPEPALA